VGWLGFESPRIDRILDEARAEPSTDKRDQLYRKLFDHIIPEATYVYTVHANYVSAARANVRNWEQLPATLVRYANVWIDR
jgi:ABC-type transport system substrate-binding protein